MFKYLSDMGHFFLISIKQIIFFFNFSLLGRPDMALGKKVAIFQLGMGPQFGP